MPCAALLALLSFLGALGLSTFAKAATMEDLDAIVQEAGGVDGLLSNWVIQDKYFKALHEYYGDPFPRESFDRILSQLATVVAKVPQLEKQLWEEIPKSSLVVSSEIPTTGRGLDETIWTRYLNELQSSLAVEAAPFIQATAGDGNTSHTRISEAMDSIEDRVREFEQTIVGLKKKDKAAIQTKFYLALENDPEVKSIAAHIVAEHFSKPEVAAKLKMGDPDVLIETLRDMQKNQMPLLPPAEFAKGRKFPPGLANAVLRQLPNTDQLLENKSMFPVQMMKTSKGLAPVPAGPARPYEIRTISRRIHGIFKGIKIGECVGGSCDWLNSTSPERWATVALRGSRVFHVERDGSYLGFIEEVAIVRKADGKIYTSLNIGTPQFANKVISVNRKTGEYEPATLFERWLASVAGTPPSTLDAHERKKWGGYVIGQSFAINNAKALPPVKSTTAFDLFGKLVGHSKDFSHLDSLGDAVPGIVPRVGFAAQYGGRMIFDAFVPDAGFLTKLGAVDPQLVRDPVRFRQLADRANPATLQRLITYLLNPGDNHSEINFRKKRLMLLRNHKDVHVRFAVCRSAESFLAGCGEVYRDVLHSPTASATDKENALGRIREIQDKKFANKAIRELLGSVAVREVAKGAVAAARGLGMHAHEILALAKEDSILEEVFKTTRQSAMPESSERQIAWNYVRHENLAVRTAAQTSLLDVPNSALRLLGGQNTIVPDLVLRAFSNLTEADFKDEAALPVFKRFMEDGDYSRHPDADEIKGRAALSYFNAGGAATDIPSPILSQLLLVSPSSRTATGHQFLTAMTGSIESRRPGYLKLVDFVAGLETVPRALAKSAISVLLESPDWAQDSLRQKQFAYLDSKIAFSDTLEIAADLLHRDPETPWRQTVITKINGYVNNKAIHFGPMDKNNVFKLFKAMIPIMRSGPTELRKAAAGVLDEIVEHVSLLNKSVIGAFPQFNELFNARAASGLPMSSHHAAGYFRFASEFDSELVAKYVSSELVKMKHAQALVYATEVSRSVPTQRDRIGYFMRYHRETPELKQLQEYVREGYTDEELARMHSRVSIKTLEEPDNSRKKRLQEEVERLRVFQDQEVTKEAARKKSLRLALRDLAASDESNVEGAVKRLNRYLLDSRGFYSSVSVLHTKPEEEENLVKLFKMLERGEFSKLFQRYPTGQFLSDNGLGGRLALFRDSLSIGEQVDFDKKIRSSALEALKGGTLFKKKDRVSGLYWAIGKLDFLYRTNEEAHEILEALVRRANATSFGRQILWSSDYFRNMALTAIGEIHQKMPIGRDFALQIISPPFALSDKSETAVLRLTIAQDYIDDPKVAKKILKYLSDSDPQVRRTALQILVSKRNEFPLELQTKLKESLVTFAKSGYAHELDKFAGHGETKFGQLITDLGFDGSPEFVRFARRGEFRSRVRASPVAVCAKLFSGLFSYPRPKLD